MSSSFGGRGGAVTSLATKKKVSRSAVDGDETTTDGSGLVVNFSESPRSSSKAISLRDSNNDDSDSDGSYPPKETRSPSLQKLLRAFTGEEEGEDANQFFLPATGLEEEDEERSIHSDDCMILTDDEDEQIDAADDDEIGIRGRLSVHQELVQGRDSMEEKDSAALAAVFAGKHPWRQKSKDDVLEIPDERLEIPADSVRSVESLSVDTPYVQSRAVIPPMAFSARASANAAQLQEEYGGEEASASDGEESVLSSTSEDSAALSMQSSESALSDPELVELDFDTLEFIPNSFLGQPQVLGSMLDPSLHNMSKLESSRFALEHALLLRAILQLLAERDLVGVEADVNDPNCILKKGPLKKLSHSVGRRNTWKVKYVEIRPGSISYFQDNAKTKATRKTIPLRSHNCTLEVLKKNVFALTVEGGGPRRLWMTNSEDELKAWVRVFQEAMIGDLTVEATQELDLTLYEDAINEYRMTRFNLQFCRSREEFLESCDKLYQTTIRIPIQWVWEQVEGAGGETRNNRHQHISIQKRMKSSVAQFWKNLRRESVCINGHTINSQSPRGAERIVGALTRSILEFDKTSPIGTRADISELQAVSYARDVLATVLRIRNKDDAHFALDYLCHNPDLVIVLPVTDSRLQPLRLQVSYATVGAIDPDCDRVPDMNGWVITRSGVNKSWKKRYFVLSEGVLSWFEHSSPRPHGLKGQLVLAGATVKEVKDKTPQDEHLFILQVEGKSGDKERQLSFGDEEISWEWKGAIQKAIDLCSAAELDDPTTSRLRKKVPGGRIIKGASGSGVKIIKGATGILRVIRPKPGDRGDDIVGYAHSSSGVSEGGGGVNSSPPTVYIVAEGGSMYKIITSEPTGDEADDTWVTVSAKFTQTFMLSGGFKGRLVSGVELVEMEFREGVANPKDFATPDMQQPP